MVVVESQDTVAPFVSTEIGKLEVITRIVLMVHLKIHVVPHLEVLLELLPEVEMKLKVKAQPQLPLQFLRESDTFQNHKKIENLIANLSNQL